MIPKKFLFQSRIKSSDFKSSKKLILTPGQKVMNHDNILSDNKIDQSHGTYVIGPNSSQPRELLPRSSVSALEVHDLKWASLLLQLHFRKYALLPHLNGLLT